MSGSAAPEPGIDWNDLFPGTRDAPAAINVADGWAAMSPEVRVLYRSAVVAFDAHVELWRLAGATPVNSRYMALWSLGNMTDRGGK